MNMASSLLARSHVYGLLTRLYGAAPTRELLTALSDPEISGELGRFLAPESQEGNNFLDQAEDLAVEHCRLFVGPPPVVSPFETLFAQRRSRTNPPRYGNPAARELSAFYETAGFAPPSGFSGLPDHISVETAYMLYSIRKALAAHELGNGPELSRHLERQQWFLTEHLSNWVPQFCRQVKACTSATFYAALAGFTTDFVRFDGRQLNDLLLSQAASIPLTKASIRGDHVIKEAK